MKKTLLITALSILVVAGYFVGQATLNQAIGSSGKKSSSENYSGSGLYSNSASGSSSYSDEIGTDKAMDYPASTGVIDNSVGNPVDTLPPVGNPKGDKLVKSGTVEITIDRNSVSDKYDDVVSLIPEGGYVEGSRSKTHTSTLTVRIPSEKLDETLVALRKLGTVTNEEVNSLDRSWDAIDYDARLKIMREREVVLNDLLKKATTVTETANIQEQIFALRTQIESLQGEKDLLDNQVALSTLTITLTEKGVKKDSPEDQTMLGKAWTKSANALLTSFGGILIVFTAILPFLIVGLAIYFAVRTVIKKSKKKDSKESKE